MEEIKDLVGKRILVQDAAPLNPVYEVRILEVAPSGDYVKVQYAGGDKWDSLVHFNERYKIIEVLGDEKPKLSTRRRTTGKII